MPIISGSNNSELSLSEPRSDVEVAVTFGSQEPGVPLSPASGPSPMTAAVTELARSAVLSRDCHPRGSEQYEAVSDQFRAMSRLIRASLPRSYTG